MKFEVLSTVLHVVLFFDQIFEGMFAIELFLFFNHRCLFYKVYYKTKNNYVHVYYIYYQCNQLASKIRGKTIHVMITIFTIGLFWTNHVLIISNRYKLYSFNIPLIISINSRSLCNNLWDRKMFNLLA